MRPFFQFLILTTLVLAGVSFWVASSDVPPGELLAKSLQAPAAETVVATPTEGPSPTPEPTGIDTTPPQIVAIDVVPGEVDTVAQSQLLTMTIHIVDDLSGFGQATLRFMPAAGSTQFLEFQIYSGQRVSGDRRDGVYVATATMPKYSVYGRWYLSTYTVSDNANNLYETYSLEYRGVPQEPATASVAEPFYIINGEDSGPLVMPAPTAICCGEEPVEAPPLPTPVADVPPPSSEDNGAASEADATPGADKVFIPSLSN